MLYPAALQKNDSGNPDGWAHTSRMCYYIQPPLVCQPRTGPPDSFVRGPAWEQFIAQYSQEKREGRQKRAEAQSPSRQHRRQRWGGSFRGWQ